MKNKAALFTLIGAIVLQSCATIFANRSACHTRPQQGEPQRMIRPIPIILDILLAPIFPFGAIIDFADGAVYKPCQKQKSK